MIGKVNSVGSTARRGLVGIATVVAAVAACGTPEAVKISDTEQGGIEGLQAKRTVSELGSLADVVVVGLANDTVIEHFAANEQIPPAAHDEIGYVNGRYAKTQITVKRVLKGDPPKDLSTARLHSTRGSDGTVDLVEGGANEASLRRGNRYVLFLVRGDSLWTGHYLSLGAQGVGVVKGDLVRFNSGETLQMDELILQIPPPTPPKRNHLQ